VTTTPFIGGWEFRGGRTAEYTPVTLPHDAMIGETRGPGEASWAHGAYFPGGRYSYRTRWTPGSEIAGKEVSLRFEGAYRHSRVLLDGREFGGSVSGYREFEVRLDPHLTPDTSHTIEVEVDNSETPNSRWYTGSGIYRPVWLEVRDRVHVIPGSVAISHRRHGTAALVRLELELGNPDAVEVQVAAVIARNGAVSAEADLVVDGTTAAMELVIAEAALWSADSPELYDLGVVLTADGRETDELSRRVGLRTIELDAERGLLVNDRVVTLRGANIHHDSGVLGAATFAGAERRRVRILKEAGFNAIRSAHNAASRALLDACDEYGMYVMDEAFDGWYDHKTDRDDAERFDELWRAELASMVAKDRLHPSVIMYSVGNENGEAFGPRGRRVAAELVGEVRRLDSTRPVTLGVNLVAAAFAGIAGDKDADDASAKAAPDMTSTALNVISNRFGILMRRFPRLRAADRATSELFALVDVAGYNYGSARYRIDAALHPDRLIVGTETMPGDLARNWALVEQLPSLIGDFVWAGWDYLGEAGGGSWAYGTRRAPFLKPYPQLVSGMGIIDITGTPGAAIHLARAAWGLLDTPAITVRPLDVRPGPYTRTSWRSTDAVESWSWSGHEGERAELEIYSADDEVEVLVNGRSLGRRAAGRSHGFLARFRARYEPGVVEAVGYRDGHAVTRAELHTAGAARLRLVAENDLLADPLEVAFLRVELADADGVVDTAASDVVTVTVDGPAEVVGLGSADPASEESFADLQHATYRGRALLVVRSTGGAGIVTVTASSRAHGSTRHSFEIAETRATSSSDQLLKGRHR